MTTRKIKDAKDLSDGSLIYFKGHAKATYMSDGSTVEDAIKNIKPDVDLSGYVKSEELKGYAKTSDIPSLEGYVKQEEGKGLSAEDFTTVLKQKLESLSNFDSSEIESSLSGLQQQIDTLVNSNASKAIDTFNEIIAFLEGIENTEDLSSIIASIERQIANINVPTAVSELINDKGYVTSEDTESKLQEAKDYTDAKIAELQEGVVTQKIELANGYNWISLYVKASLRDLQSALGNKATLIQTSNNGTSAANINTEYNAETNTWSGDLTELNYTSMYQIHCSEACSIEVKGTKLNPSELEYTILPGTTWISYPLDKELSIVEALVGLSCAEGDQLKHHNGVATYYNDFGWWGTDIQPMIPGKGYMYVNATNETKTFYFPSNEEENGDFETKEDALAKLEEAKEYTDAKTNELRDIVTQTLSLTSGVIWCSFYVDITLEQLQQALGTNAASITTSFDGDTEVTSSYDASTNAWSGELTALDITKMYMIKVNTDCEISLTGRKIPNSTVYTLNPGWNWIGYPVNEEINVTEALANLDPKAGDIIKSQKRSAYYIGTSWKVEVGWDRIIPGQGYKYNNTSESVKNLIYTTSSIDIKSELLKKQDSLISGENIKTINGESLLGEGDIIIDSLPEIPEDSDGKLLKVAGNEYSLKHLTSDDIKKEIYIYLKAGINYVTIFSSYNATAVGGRQVMRDVKEQLGDKCEYIKLYKNDGTGTIIETTTTYNIETGLWEGELDSITRDACYVFKMTQTLSISYFTKSINPSATLTPYLYTGQNYLPFTFHKNKTAKEIIEQLTALTPASFNDKLVINHTYTFIYEDIGNGTGKWFPYGDYSDNFSVRPGSGMVYIRTSSNMGVVEWLDDTWDIPDNTVKYIQSQTSECKSYTDDKISSLGVIPQIVYVPNEYSMPSPPVEGVLYLIGDEEV